MSNLCGVLALTNKPPDADELHRMASALGVRDIPTPYLDDRCGLLCLPRAQSVSETACLLSVTAFSSEAEEGSATIAFDGHVYNHRDVRAAIRAAGITFQTDSASETLLQGYLRFGPLNFIKAFRGKFAFAIWDRAAHRLLLGRDRLGQNPIYYTQTSHRLIFASSIQSVLAHPAVRPDLNRSVIPQYLAYGYPPAPETLYSGIRVLQPGCLLSAQVSVGEFSLSQDTYWLPPHSHSGDDPRSDQNIAADLLAHLRGAVRLRMEGEQPLGVQLSGDLASSAILALLNEEADQQISTFSISLDSGADFDERRQIRRLAARYVTDHNDIALEPELPAVLDELLGCYAQPFGDVSALPTFLLAREARAQVPVLFTGSGGNEIFAGYARFQVARLTHSYDQLPEVAQRAIVEVMDRLSGSLTYAGFMRQANEVVRAAEHSLADRYLSWVRLTPASWLIALLGGQREQAVSDHFRSLLNSVSSGDESDVVATLLDLNLRTQVPSNLLVQLDRAGRASDLDVRLPFLDHVLIHFVSTIPSQLKLRRWTPNYILKQALHDILPVGILERKSRGMRVPVDDWFRGKLASFSRDVLTGPGAASRGIFDMTAVQAMLDAHQTGQADLGDALWTLLTFELWLQRSF